MHVIVCTSHRQGLKGIFARDSSQVRPEIGLFCWRDQAAAVLGGEHAVKKFGNIRVRHGVSAVPAGLGSVTVCRPGAEALGYFRSSLRDGRSASVRVGHGVSVVPAVLTPVTVCRPGAEAPGYFQSSLRDLHLLPVADPALKRWAIFGRPNGSGALLVGYPWDSAYSSATNDESATNLMTSLPLTDEVVR